ncbi:hypothetical protein K7X08_031895 [Anisodus acutangulus]|uniref:Adipocyte plasma membrane-associated protein n=1 Tax=Anisodus acutangulus TaxID=402998 RepID=A0A9Q1MM83_9SOLA|nr:hypothetical protein K7X08_031895 [Anisodus acutangulus]
MEHLETTDSRASSAESNILEDTLPVGALSLKGILFCWFTQQKIVGGKDGSSFVFCEGAKGRLQKYWLKGEKAGTSEVMAVLPGYPDNVRANERGEFWVAIHSRATIYSYINSKDPQLRLFLLKLPIPVKLRSLLHGGQLRAIIVKCSPEGKLLQILEDGEGKVVIAVSEVEERDGKLWMGSVLMPFIAVYQLE